ncbi:MAG: methyltransferase domain-containing protein [Sedimentisphaerales bacterium]|nr:methyltransferase domain-containing protein [Sedimentisphaerales bacterium]
MRIIRIRFIISLGLVLIFAEITPFTNVFNISPGEIKKDKQVVLFEQSQKTDLFTYSSLVSGDGYNSYPLYSSLLSGIQIFELELFTQKSESERYFIFARMSLIIFISCTIFLCLMLMNVRLTILSLVPVFLSLVCTLGLLMLAVQSLNVFGLLLALSLPVLSTFSSFLIVRFYQRYHNQAFGILDRKRLSVFIGFAATMAGLGFMFTTNHNLFKGPGLLVPVGIGFITIGAFVILRYLLFWFDRKESGKKCLSENLQDRVIWRYRNMDVYSRFFGFFKIRLDPMFSELPGLLEKIPPVKTIIDIGTGYGVPAVWFLEKLPEVRIFGLDPDKDRIRVASQAISDRGKMTVGGAPEVPSPSESADLATLLDVIQYIDDEALEITLKRLSEKLCPNGMILLRISVPLEKGNPWPWWIERIRVSTQRITTHYRSVNQTEEMLQKAGFTIQYTGPSGKNGDLFWLLGTLKKDHPLG